MRTAATLLQANDHHLDRVLDYLKSPEPAGDDMEIVFADAAHHIRKGHEKGELYVWEESPNSEPEGFIVGSLNTGYLKCMEVRNVCRGRGTGTEMLNAFSLIASDHGAPGLFGDCRTQALQFWLKHGFSTPVGQVLDERLANPFDPALLDTGYIPPIGVWLYKTLPRENPAFGKEVAICIELRLGENSHITTHWDVVGFGDSDEVVLPRDWVVACPPGATGRELRFILNGIITPWRTPTNLARLGVEPFDKFIRIRRLSVNKLMGIASV